MNRRREPSRGRYQLYGAVLLIVAAVFIAATIGIYAKVFRSEVPVSLETDRVGNQMRVGADVKVRGAVVGDVTEIRQSDDGAVLELALQPDKADLVPAGVTAKLLPKTLFGERYVALDTSSGGGTGPIAAGAVIPQDRSEGTIEIEKVLDDLMPVLQALQPQKLSTTLSAISNALQGRGEQAGETLVGLNDYLQKLDPALPDLEAVLGRIDDVANTYADAAPELLTALEDLSATSRTVVENREQIAGMLGSLTTTAQDGTRFLAANRENFINVTAESRATLEVLEKYAPQYPCMLTQFADQVETGERSFGKGKKNPEMGRFTIEFTASRGKYVPGRDDPEYNDKRGPRCYPWVQNPDVFPQYPPGGPVDDGSYKPPPPRESPLPVRPPGEGVPTDGEPAPDFGDNPASTTPNSASAPQIKHSAAERDLLGMLLAPSMGVAPDEVPRWSDLLVGPVFRGQEVTVR
ncbi:MCE family protein [Allosaccharopolyspora coralli]|uniref:MCE family protein n=1 Tax=Allosaccharopolyspora coralli TaxID=2665642 RepID=A0A5Q3Q7A2_9PSEU|nr:MCE family protein [Allosaccharopolyspora coralli]QGK70352.1 MCE family protein [Allosaccharopolyspora coralli]